MRLRGRWALFSAIAAAAAAVLALAPSGDPSRGQQPASGATPGMNVIVVLTDDQSHESVARMPKLSARQDLITFDNAFLNVALCCPSRASLLSGRSSTHTGVETNKDNRESCTSGAACADGRGFDEKTSVARWLKKQSPEYRTSLIGKYLNNYPWNRGHYVPPYGASAPDWDNWRVFERAGYCSYTMNINKVFSQFGSGADTCDGTNEDKYSTDVLARYTDDFLTKRVDDKKPFFLLVAPNAPHGPRLPAPRHREADVGPIPRSPNFNEEDVSDKPGWVRKLPLQDPVAMDELRRDEYRTLLAVDDLVDGIFQKLDSGGLSGNTVVMYLTDNGYSFGEHRFIRKRCEYDECIRTPLLVRYPEQPGRHVTELVENIDVAPTIAELTGITPPAGVDGRSMVPFLKGTPPPSPWRTGVLLRWIGGYDFSIRNPNPSNPTGDDYYVPPYWGVRTGRYKYVELQTASSETELYDLAADPHEMSNVTDDPAYAAVKASLASELAARKAAG